MYYQVTIVVVVVVVVVVAVVVINTVFQSRSKQTDHKPA